jgi:hypothetical protein
MTPMTSVCERLHAWAVPAIVPPRPAPSSVDGVLVEDVPPGHPGLCPTTRFSGDVGHARDSRENRRSLRGRGLDGRSDRGFEAQCCAGFDHGVDAFGAEELAQSG